ncbi:hypothetical protein ACJIZ3_008729 [Penstemon smallii]|uniref:Uncharacterized protein n=1 Tax=Penstemon smallii TaxID=265156 RepID=A0ABD3TBN1_9LAMI
MVGKPTILLNRIMLATGDGACSFVDAVVEDVTDDDRYTTPKNKGKRPSVETIFEDIPEYVNIGTDGEDDPYVTPDCMNKGAPKVVGLGSKSLVGHKRKSGESSREDNIYLDRFINSTESTLGTLMGKLDKEVNPPPRPSTLAKKVYENVVKFNIEPAETRFFVITKIGANPYYTDLFLSMPENDQANFVNSIINGSVM